MSGLHLERFDLLGSSHHYGFLKPDQTWEPRSLCSNAMTAHHVASLAVTTEAGQLQLATLVPSRRHRRLLTHVVKYPAVNVTSQRCCSFESQSASSNLSAVEQILPKICATLKLTAEQAAKVNQAVL